MEEQAAVFEGWCILELMGHRRLGGFVKEVQVAGAGFLRIDVWADNDKPAEAVITQFYPPSSVYCLTPTTEAMARAVAKSNMPQPVQRWELPALPPRAEVSMTGDAGPDEFADDDLTDEQRDEIF
jgi:hypothetical protein